MAETTRQGGHLQIGLPVQAITSGVTAAEADNDGRIYLSIPLDLLWAALGQLPADTQGQATGAGGGEDAATPVTIELNDDDFDVSGHRIYRS